MSKVFNRAQSRVLARRVKEKFTPDKEDLTKVRVVSGGVAQVAGQLYNSATGGFRAGTVVEATNVGTAGNAQYVAKYANQTKTELDELGIRKLVNSMLDDFLNSPEFLAAIPEPETNVTIPSQGELFRDSVGPVTTAGQTTFTATIPSSTITGDLLVFVVGSGSATTESLTIPAGWEDGFWNGYSPNGVNVAVVYRVAAGTAGETSTDAGDTVTIEYDVPLTTDNAVQILYVLNGNRVGAYVNSDQSASSVGEPNTTATIPDLAFGSTLAIAIGLYVIVSEDNTTIIPNVGLTELIDIGTATCGVFVAYRVLVGASESPLMTCTQSASVRQISGGIVFEGL